MLSSTEEMAAQDLQPRSKALSFETVPANGEIATALQIAPGKSVFKLQRIRLADSIPMGIEPRSHKDLSAWRAVMRLTARWFAISCSEGTGSPASSAPERI
ncbi:MAG: UTRA domain-containing protein [Candidatus Sulfotelmatobacter sp.]